MLFRDRPDPGEQTPDCCLRLCDAADSDTVDMLILNDADPILASEALNGEVLCKNDLAETAGFQSLICREYEGVMGHLAQQRKMQHEHVTESEKQRQENRK